MTGPDLHPARAGGAPRSSLHGGSPGQEAAARGFRDVLADWIPRGSEVAIVDVPVHRNLGDLFIYAVAGWLLAERRCNTVYRAGVRDYRREVARRHVERDTILVGLGGGNFGDRYPRYQALREQVAADFPNNRFVVLPQTVRFADAAAAAHAAAVLRRHGDLRIAVRDDESLAFARRCTDRVALLPDIVDAAGLPAFDACAGAERQRASRPPRVAGGTLRVLRTDRERRGALTASDPTGATGRVDWRDLLPGFEPRLISMAAALLVARGPVAARLHAWWARAACEFFVGAVDAIRGADRVVTDRLHAAILARIAGRPVTLLPDGFGKLAAYRDAWWLDDPAVTMAEMHEPEGSPARA